MHLQKLSLLPNVVFPNPWPLIAWPPLGETPVFKVFVLPLSQLRRCATKTVEFKSSSHILSTESSPSEKQPLLRPPDKVATHVTPPPAVYWRCSGILIFLSRRIERSNSSLAVATAQRSLALRRVIAATPGLTSASRHSSSTATSVSRWLRLTKRHIEKREAESYERASHFALCCFLAINDQETHTYAKWIKRPGRSPLGYMVKCEQNPCIAQTKYPPPPQLTTPQPPSTLTALSGCDYTAFYMGMEERGKH